MTTHPDLSPRLIAFSARIIRLLDHLPNTKTAREIEGQLIRSGMGVGSNYNEVRGADSRADFCHKLQIALKEMRETHYWLSVIDEAKLIADARHLAPLLDEATQLRAILGKSVATARGKARMDRERTNLPSAGSLPR
jgi:four helix bundle protein